MLPVSVPYRDFYYPLNVFMHVLTHEEGGVDYLHYGLFENADESISSAQEHSTELLLERLPSPPSRVLEVGTGLGTTLLKLKRAGYAACGITPDEKQIAMIRARHDDELDVAKVAFENLFPRPFDVVIFQESAQYINSSALFAKAREITCELLILDEFSANTTDKLHSLDGFLRSAAEYGFRKKEEIDLSQKATPTIDYFLARLPRYRDDLVKDLGLQPSQIDELIESGRRYRDLYSRGVYLYKLLWFVRGR